MGFEFLSQMLREHSHQIGWGGEHLMSSKLSVVKYLKEGQKD